MEYRYYEDWRKTYVVVFVTGLGIQEDNFVDHCVVYDDDNYEIAKQKANALTLVVNTPEEIRTCWCNKRFKVNINTASLNGQILRDEFIKNNNNTQRKRYDKH